MRRLLTLCLCATLVAACGRGGSNVVLASLDRSDEIQLFCSTNYGVTFPMFSKIDVNGPGRHALYAWLTQQDTKPEGPGDVQWNFGKFLVGKDGAVLARFEPPTDPKAPDVVSAIEAAL